MMKTDPDVCPNCGLGTNTDGDNPNPEGDWVLACAPCGYVGIWDTGLNAWRDPDVDERALLLEDDRYMEVMGYSFVFRQFQEADRARLTTIVRAGAEQTVDELVDAIMKAGFHTHVAPSQLPDLDGDQ